MPLDTNTVAPTLLDAVAGLDCPLPDSTPTQRGALADRLEASAETIMDCLSWADVSRTGEDHFGDAASKVRRALRGAARELRDYTPPVPAPAPAPVYEWGQRVMAMRHGRPVEAFFVSGPDGDGDLKVVCRGADSASYVQAKDVSPIAPAAVPEPVAPPAPRRPRVGDLVRVLEGGVYPPGTIGTLTMVDFDNEARVEANGQTTGNWHLFRHFDVIRPAGWTPKVGDKVKVVGLSRFGFAAGDAEGTVTRLYYGRHEDRPVFVEFREDGMGRAYATEQVYPASL